MILKGLNGTGFEGFYTGDGFQEGFEEGTTFMGLSEIQHH
jgi:hypothetical protein